MADMHKQQRGELQAERQHTLAQQARARRHALYTVRAAGPTAHTPACCMMMKVTLSHTCCCRCC
jgi:hypothetical protein